MLTLDETDLTNSRVEAVIEAASIETRDAQRDAHLKSPDFFHMEKFPTLSFKSTDIRLVRDGELAVEGDLTIRGVTRKVLFAVDGPTPPTKDPWGGTRVAVSATTKINRKDFGLTWNGTQRSRPVASWLATRWPSRSTRNSSELELSATAHVQPVRCLA